jgi:hypothetical protein
MNERGPINEREDGRRRRTAPAREFVQRILVKRPGITDDPSRAGQDKRVQSGSVEVRSTSYRRDRLQTSREP